MTASTTTINPGTGGDKILNDTLTTVDGSAAPSGAVAQVMKLAYGTQSDAKMVSSTQALPISNNATVFLFSTNNSSTTQLAAGATFTGTIETALDQPSLSLLMTSDQDMIVTVRQFIDLAGTRAAPNIVFSVPANNGLARSLPLNGNYVQVLAQNVGASTTTTFNINTAYGDILPADNSGALPTTELPLVLAGQSAQTAIVNNILTTTAGTAGIDVSGYRAASVQIKSTATGGTFIFEQSNVGGVTATDWIPLPVFNGALTTGVPITAAITATASAIIYSFAIRCTFVRLRIVTTLTGGSIQAFSRFSTDSWTPSVNLVASNTAANLQTTATISGNPVLGAGTNAVGDVGIQYRANATGAATTFKFASAATVNNALILTGARRLLGWSLTNTTASFKYFRFYNSATAPASGASPTFMVGIPPNSTVVSPPVVGGIALSLGLGIACTGAVADTDATVTAANDVVGSIHYV